MTANRKRPRSLSSSAVALDFGKSGSAVEADAVRGTRDGDIPESPCYRDRREAACRWPPPVQQRFSRWRGSSAGDVASDLPSECAALEVGVSEVESDEDACPVDILDDLVQPVVAAGGVRGAAVEGHRDFVGAEEGIEGGDDGGAVAGVRRGVLGEVRRRRQRLPGGVGGGLRIAVRVGSRNCLVGAPEPVVVFGVEAGDQGVAAGDVRHCKHARGLDEVETTVGGEAEQAVVPHPEVVVGPEQRLLGLLGRPGGAVDCA